MLNDFKNILLEAQETKPLTTEQMVNKLNSILKGFYCAVECKEETSNDIKFNLTVKNKPTTSKTGVIISDIILPSNSARYPIGIIFKCLSPDCQKNSQRLEPIILTYGEFKYNALRILNKKTTSYGEVVYEIVFNINGKKETIISSKPIVLRGHGTAGAIRAKNVPFQEASQALSILTKMYNNIDLTTADNVFHFKIYDNQDTKSVLIDKYNKDKDIYEKTGLAARTIPGFNSMTELSDMSFGDDDNEIDYSMDGLGNIIRKIFNKCNKKEAVKYRNINSYFPADIIAYVSGAEKLFQNVNSIEQLTAVINSNRQSLIPLSLKLNKSRDKSKYEQNKGNSFEFLSVTPDVVFGEIVLHILIKHNNKPEEISMVFKCFGNDKRASIEHNYKHWERTDKLYNEVELRNVNADVNTDSVLGKAWNSLEVFMAKYKMKIKSNNDKDLTLLELRSKPALESVMLSEKELDNVLVDSIKNLYVKWLNYADYAIRSGLCKNIDEFLLYTYCAGIKCNFQKMQCYPRFEKIS